MAEELDPIKQRIDIEVNDKGVDKASKNVDDLTVSINESTQATTKQANETKKNDDAFKSLKVQLKEAVVLQQKLAQQYGATSAEAVEAAKNVAKIKDEIGFQKDLVESYNPDEKFRGLTQTAGLAALALGGVKDGLSAIGIESKALDQVIGTAQAILGVTTAVAGLTDAYEVLTATQKAKSAAEVVSIGTTEALAVAEGEATVATWSFNTALLANPIVAITAAIVAGSAAIYAFVKITGDAAKEEEKARVASLQLNTAIDKQAKSFENNSKFLAESNSHKIALLRASGASEAQIYRETKALREQERQLALNNEREAERIEQRAYNAARAASFVSDLDAQKRAEDDLKKAKENLEKARDARRAINDSAIKDQQAHEVALVQAETDARIKREEEAKKAREKAQENAKKKKEDALKEAEEFKKLLQNQAAAEAEEKNKIQEAINVANEKKNEFSMSAQEKEIQEVSDKYFVLIEKAKQYGLDTNALEEARLNEQNEINLKYQQIDSDNKEKAKEDEIARDKAITEAKKENQELLVSQGESFIQNVSKLAGKNKAIQKATIIADGAISLGKAAVNTSEAVTKDLAKGAPFSAPLVALDIAVGATSAAAIIKNTASALKAVGGGGSISGASGGGATPQPSRNVAQVGFQASPESQISTAISQSQKDQPPIKAFVVSKEVTDQQELERKKELNNSF